MRKCAMNWPRNHTWKVRSSPTVLSGIHPPLFIVCFNVAAFCVKFICCFNQTENVFPIVQREYSGLLINYKGDNLWSQKNPQSIIKKIISIIFICACVCVCLSCNHIIMLCVCFIYHLFAYYEHQGLTMNFQIVNVIDRNFENLWKVIVIICVHCVLVQPLSDLALFCSYALLLVIIPFCYFHWCSLIFCFTNKCFIIISFSFCWLLRSAITA